MWCLSLCVCGRVWWLDELTTGDGSQYLLLYLFLRAQNVRYCSALYWGKQSFNKVGLKWNTPVPNLVFLLLLLLMLFPWQQTDHVVWEAFPCFDRWIAVLKGDKFKLTFRCRYKHEGSVCGLDSYSYAEVDGGWLGCLGIMPYGLTGIEYETYIA